jgi:hypothetical protein
MLKGYTTTAATLITAMLKSVTRFAMQVGVCVCVCVSGGVRARLHVCARASACVCVCVCVCVSHLVIEHVRALLAGVISHVRSILACVQVRMRVKSVHPRAVPRGGGAKRQGRAQTLAAPGRRP